MVRLESRNLRTLIIILLPLLTMMMSLLTVGITPLGTGEELLAFFTTLIITTFAWAVSLRNIINSINISLRNNENTDIDTQTLQEKINKIGRSILTLLIGSIILGVAGWSAYFIIPTFRTIPVLMTATLTYILSMYVSKKMLAYTDVKKIKS